MIQKLSKPDIDWDNKRNSFVVMKGAHKGKSLVHLTSAFLSKLVQHDTALFTTTNIRQACQKILVARANGKLEEPRKLKTSSARIEDLFLNRKKGWLIMDSKSKHFGKYIHQVSDLAFMEDLLMSYNNLPQALVDAVRLSMSKGNCVRKSPMTREQRIKMTFNQ